MIVNEPRTQPATAQERREAARQRAMAKIEQEAIDAELQQMAKEDEAQAAAEAARIEAARQAEARKIQLLTELRAKYVKRAELASQIKNLVAEFVGLDVELAKAEPEILGRPRIGSMIGEWRNYVTFMRRSAGLLPAHELLGCPAPTTNAEAIGITAARAIVNGSLGPGWIRMGERYSEFDFTHGC